MTRSFSGGKGRGGVRRGIALLTPLVAGLVAWPAAFAAAEKVVWRSDADYVRIEPQDPFPDGRRPPPNDHPVRFSPDELAAILGALRAPEEGQSILFIELEEPSGPRPVFPGEAPEKISGPLSRALATAGPREDVTFAVSGFQKNESVTIIGESLTTSGRMFFVGGALHLIFGEVRYKYDERMRKTGRANPKGPSYVGPTTRLTNKVDPGAREREGDMPAPIAPVEGVKFMSANNRPREDWLVIEPQTLLAAVSRERRPTETAPQTAARPAPAGEPRGDDLRERVDELERELQEVRQQPAAAPAPSAPSAPSASPPPADDAEARLRRIKDLYERGVITQDAYLDKAAEILEAY